MNSICQKDFPSGKLNKKQFFQIYKNSDSKMSFGHHIFRAFDRNDDGAIGIKTFSKFKNNKNVFINY